MDTTIEAISAIESTVSSARNRYERISILQDLPARKLSKWLKSFDARLRTSRMTTADMAEVLVNRVFGFAD